MAANVLLTAENDPTRNLVNDHFYLYKKIDDMICVYGTGTPDAREIVQKQNSMKRGPTGKGVKFMKGSELKERYSFKEKKPRAKRVVKETAED